MFPLGAGRSSQAEPSVCRTDIARSNRRLLAWTALVVISALLIVVIRVMYDVPPDLRYRYSTLAFAVTVSALQFVLVIRIADNRDLQEVLALKRPTWGWKRVTIFAFLIVVGMTLLLISVPLLQQGESEGNGAPFDPHRTLPFFFNALVLVIITPLLEEAIFRGLGFKLLERFGEIMAIVLTALAFAVFHGQFQQLPGLIVFGLALGYLRSRTESIYPCIATHSLLNSVGVMLALGM